MKSNRSQEVKRGRVARKAAIKVGDVVVRHSFQTYRVRKISGDQTTVCGGIHGETVTRNSSEFSKAGKSALAFNNQGVGLPSL